MSLPDRLSVNDPQLPNQLCKTGQNLVLVAEELNANDGIDAHDEKEDHKGVGNWKDCRRVQA